MRQSAVTAVPEFDRIGPWSVLVGEHIDGARPIVSAYGPVPREGACGVLEVLGLVAFDEPLMPFRAVIEEEGLTTIVSVAFGHEAIYDLLLADRYLGIDPDERYRLADTELAERRAAGLHLVHE
jgi:hypothetical protein